MVIRMPALELKGGEDGDPSIFGWKMNHQCAVLPVTILTGESATIPLIHVNVVNAVPGVEVENLVRNL